MALNIKEYVRECIGVYLPIIKDRFSGDSSVKFKVADAVADDEAVTKSQLDSGLSNKAKIDGNSSIRFKASYATTVDEVVPKGQIDDMFSTFIVDTSDKADLYGNSNNEFYVADSSEDNHAVNRGQLLAELNAINTSIEGVEATKADLGGNPSVNFKVKDASTDDEAVNKGQVEDMIPSLAEMVYNVKSSEGCINSNPYFYLGNYDYSSFSSTKLSIVEDIVSSNKKAMKWVGGSSTCIGTHKMFAPKGREYRVTVDVRSRLNGGADPDGHKSSQYVGLASYDSDSSIIRASYLPSRPKAEVGIVTIAAAQGDTSITLSGDINWFDPDDAEGINRQLVLYLEQSNGELCCIGTNGRVYEHLGYSKYMPYDIAGHYDQFGIADNGDGTITIALRNPLPIALPVGSGVKSAQGGSSYNYLLYNVKQPIDDKWHTHTSTWTEHEQEYSHGYTSFVRNGAAYVKIRMLPNYKLYSSSNVNLGKVNIEMPTLTTYYGKIAYEWREKHE